MDLNKVEACEIIEGIKKYFENNEGEGLAGYTSKQIREACDYSLEGMMPGFTLFREILNATFRTEVNENKGDCTTCIGFLDKDYAQSFCYDCMRGIQNHYKGKGEAE